MKLGQFITICLSITAFLTPQKSEGQTISGVINSYHKATAIITNGTHNSYSYSGITLQSIAGLSTGDRVLIIQMKGATIGTGNNSTFGSISSIGNAGKYEFSTICGFLNNTIVLSNHFLNSYDVSEIQVVRVPVYQDAEVTAAVTPQAWDESTGLGGVLAFEVTGTLTLNAAISADGAGFAGGELLQFSSCSYFTTANAFYYNSTSVLSSNSSGALKGEGINATSTSYSGGKGKQSNGGGGGNNHNTGGGGGGNYGVGGNGGNYSGTGSFPCGGANPGIGGIEISSYGYAAANNKVFLGGGGGSGHANNPEGTPGGNGGGIIYIKAATVIGNGYSVTARGTQGINSNLTPNPLNEARGDGGGGGGAGGVILLNVTTYNGVVTIEADGADGSTVGFQNTCMGPGGGGGGGIIWSNATLPVNINTNVAGGISGFVRYLDAYNAPCEGSTNGANPGGNGVVQSGFVDPQGTNKINCSILPLDLLKQFTGKRNNRSIYLNWTFTNVDNVQKVVLERKAGNEQFRKINEQSNPTTNNGFYTDEESYSNVTYRLIVYSWNGERQYSNHVFFESDVVKTFNLYPNPATNEVTIQLPPNVNGRAGIVVTDVNGRQVQMQQVFIPALQTNTKLGLKDLPAGIYYLRLEINGEVYSTKLIKQ